MITAPTDAPAVEARGLTMRYGTLTALDAFDLTLAPGEVFGFIGPNGAGKTTTMKIIAGLLEPTSGVARVLGRDVATHGDFVRRSVGYMPDFIGVYDDLRVDEYLDFFASAYGIPRRQRRKIVDDVLELTDLSIKRDALVESLSRGMTQRLSLARVLVHDPPVLLLDEPASGLDPRARIEIRELLRELKRLGKTILVSSHILSELGEFCDSLGIIERGRLIVSGTVKDLVAKARVHPIVCVRTHGAANGAADLLRADPRISSIESVGEELHVTLASNDLHHGFVAELLVNARVPIDSIQQQQIKLEDVFLRLTQGMVQ
ncbi:MAG TPA: ABC transporter ATP-binding protein [Tepidisphaeraceae bacterium]|nr:ABC transporter ATP-binding protein [Tepidisphaeraceae bacterium]